MTTTDNRKVVLRTAYCVLRLYVGRLYASATPAPPGLGPFLKIVVGHLYPMLRQGLSDHAPLRGAFVDREAREGFQGALCHPNGQDGRLVIPLSLNGSRWLLRRGCTGRTQHLVGRDSRRWPGALKTLQRLGSCVLSACVFTSFDLTLGVFFFCAVAGLLGSHPSSRSSSTKATASAPAFPTGIRPEKPISP